jgi:hypothetical protein
MLLKGLELSDGPRRLPLVSNLQTCTTPAIALLLGLVTPALQGRALYFDRSQGHDPVHSGETGPVHCGWPGSQACTVIDACCCFQLCCTQLHAVAALHMPADSVFPGISWPGRLLRRAARARTQILQRPGRFFASSPSVHYDIH